MTNDVLANVDMSLLSVDEQRQYVEVLERIVQDQARHRMSYFFPDTGPLRRELYPKHVEFFTAGAKYRERCLMAGNRIGKCSTINSHIETPDGPALVGNLRERGGRFRVLAWDGGRKVERWAGPIFKKDQPEPCVRVTMSDGQWFEAALGHRLLTSDGWLRVGDFAQLSRLRGGLPPSPLLSSWGFGPSTHDVDAPRSTETPTGSPVGCPSGRRSGDARPPSEGAADRSPPPSQVDALRRRLRVARCGLGRTSSGSPFGCGRRASSLGVAYLLLALFAEWQGRAAGTIGQLLIESTQAVQRLLSACAFPLRSAHAADPGRWSVGAAFASGSDGASRNAPARHMSRQGDERRPTGAAVHPESEIELGPRPLPLPFVDGNRIVRVAFIGVHDVYDWPVDGLHNYCAAGLVHHNTEGAGGYETTLHLTGLYPEWWPGRRFTQAIRGWACGKTNETTRDIVQAKLFGKVVDGQRKGLDGTGLVPHERIGSVTWKQGVTDFADTVKVKHVSGDWSVLSLKSYAQGRGAFEGTEQHIIWLDEEPPLDVYGECLIRTATTDGLVYITFTPLEGATDVVTSFLPPEMLKGLMEQVARA